MTSEALGPITVRTAAPCVGDGQRRYVGPLAAVYDDVVSVMALPFGIELDTTTCSTRPATTCTCAAGHSIESVIERDVGRSSCTMTQPSVFLVFDDEGCVRHVRYAEALLTAERFESCLRDALGNRRWSCASSGTRAVIRSEGKE